MGVGAVTDFSLQIVLEYWMGGHESFATAWEQLDVNWWQVFSSAAEALWENKYGSTLLSAFSDVMNYLTSTPQEEISAAGFGQSLALGAISGYLGANAAAYVGQIGAYMTKYGPQAPLSRLRELGIHPFFFSLADFRKIAIAKLWLNPSFTGRGVALEELVSYGRYRNYTWVNAAGELNGPLDFLLDGTGVQLKTMAEIAVSGPRYSSVKSKVKKGLKQLKRAIDDEQCQTGRLDVMIPESMDQIRQEVQENLRREFIGNTNFPDFQNLEIVIGTFKE
ncbi:MAG: hypothetical protein AAFW73_26080 [Bacteroidota bacterium]